MCVLFSVIFCFGFGSLSIRLSACLSVCVFFCNISITVRQETYLPGEGGGGRGECISVSALRSGFDLTMPFPSSKPCTLPWFVCFSCASTYASYTPHTAPYTSLAPPPPHCTYSFPSKKAGGLSCTKQAFYVLVHALMFALAHCYNVLSAVI